MISGFFKVLVLLDGCGFGRVPTELNRRVVGGLTGPEKAQLPHRLQRRRYERLLPTNPAERASL